MKQTLKIIAILALLVFTISACTKEQNTNTELAEGDLTNEQNVDNLEADVSDLSELETELDSMDDFNPEDLDF